MSTGTRIILKKGSGEPDPLDLEIAELAVDVVNGDLYTKLQSFEVKNLTSGIDGGTGSSVHIGDEPANPQEGQQWMEIPNSGDATMWIYDSGNGGQWLQHPGGKDGADGVDGADGLWTDNGDTTISYSAGNVGVGTNDPKSKMVVSDNGAMGLEVIPQTANERVVISSYDRQAATLRGCLFDVDNYVVNTRGSNALTIDPTGNAVFSTEIRSNISGGAVRINPTDQSATSPHMRFWGSSGGGWYNVGRSTADGTFQINVGANFDSPSNNALTIDAAGVATFGTTVYSGNGRFARTGQSGVAFAGDGMWPTDGAGSPSDGQHNVGNPSHQWKNGFFSGSVTLRSGTAIGTRDLIETLSTLRASTLDESVDVRQALASACDKLIEKFEAMQSEAVTQEISDE